MVRSSPGVWLVGAVLAVTALGQPSGAAGQQGSKAVAMMKIDLQEVSQIERSLKEAFSKDEFEDVEAHGAEIVELMKSIRRLTVDLPDPDGEVIRLLVDRAQHAAHELEEAGKAGDHQGAHHAFENLSTELADLRRRVDRL